MKLKIQNFIKTLFAGKHKKRNIWITIAVVILIIIIFFIFSPKNNTSSIQTGFTTRQNLQETVLSTGQVVSSTDLVLSFQGSGVVRSVLVKEGDKVKRGQILVSLGDSSALATLTSARGSYAQAKANYEKLVNGLSQGDIQAYQNALASAEVNLNNAYNSSLAILNTGYTTMYSADYFALTIQDAYFTIADRVGGEARIAKSDLDINLASVKNYLDKAKISMSKQDIDLAISQEVLSLNNAFNDINIIRTQSDQDTYYNKVPATDKASLDAQKVSISTAISSVTALQSSVASYKVALQTAKDNLSAKQSAPRQEDVDLAKAQMLSAQGQVDAAQAILNNSLIVAPASGTITQIDIKVGEQATPSKEVMILQDIGSLYAEADISEANIATLQVGQPIDYTLDALGPDQHFSGKVLTINPASNVISGVVNYLVKGSLENIPNVKPGMTVNMTILVAKKDNVLAVPSTAVINKNNKQYVKVIDNSKSKTYHEVEVKTGLRADGGLIEIISGLNEGQEIIIYMKAK